MWSVQVGCLLCGMSCTVGSTAFLLVTALCWLAFRPAVGVPLLALAALLAYCACRLRKRARRLVN